MRGKISISEITNILHDDEGYVATIKSLKDYIREDIENISITVGLTEISKTVMTIGNMYTLFILMKAFNTFKEMEVTKDLILDDYSNVGSYSSYFDKVIDKFHATYEDSHSKVTILMEDITYSLNELSIFASKNVLLKAGPTISIKDIMDIGERNSEFRECMNFTHEDETSHLNNMQDKIKLQDKNNKKSIKIINEDNESQFKRLLESAGGINPDQMGEVFNIIGYKPDMRGRVITKPIDTSYFKGMRDVEDFFIDAMGARKALNTSKLQVRQSGYLNRKISILTEDIRIDEDMDDCGTQQYIKLNITSEDMFRLYIGRYYMLDGKDHLITEEDTYLIGANINLRSPITCALKHEKVCKKCYGKLSKVNIGLNVGTIANLIFTEPMTQKLLSSKHLLKVKVDVKWDKKFFKYFNIEGNIVIPKDPELEIFIDEEDFIIKDKYAINKYRTKKFYVKDEDGEKVLLESPVFLLIPDNSIDNVTDFYDPVGKTYKFSLLDLNRSDRLFTVVIRNIGVADPLLEMKDGLDKNYKMDKLHKQNLHDYHQDLIELLIKSDTYVMGIHIEVILMNMVKFVTRDILKDPSIDLLEWENEEECIRKYYRIYNINEAIYQSDSPVKSLMYQDTIRQLTTDSFNGLFGKTGDSEFDRLFIN